MRNSLRIALGVALAGSPLLVAPVLAVPVGGVPPAVAAVTFRLVDAATGASVGAFMTAGSPIEYRQGSSPSDPRKAPGRQKYESITLERGLTQDGAFGAWAKAGSSTTGSGTPPPSRSFDLQAVDATGRVVSHLLLTGCTAGASQPMPDLDGGGNALTIDHLELQCDSAITREQ